CAMTNASFVATHHTSLTPLPFSASLFCRYPGTCFAEQVGVYAPGRPKIAIFLPFTASPTLTSLGGIAHCVPESNSVLSINLPSGSLSPTLIAMGNVSWDGTEKGE